MQGQAPRMHECMAAQFAGLNIHYSCTSTIEQNDLTIELCFSSHASETLHAPNTKASKSNTNS